LGGLEEVEFVFKVGHSGKEGVVVTLTVEAGEEVAKEGVVVREGFAAADAEGDGVVGGEEGIGH
jgi:hypothetical protein